MEKNIFGLVKKFLQVARVHKKMAWGLAKMASVASGFDPTHPYKTHYRGTSISAPFEVPVEPYKNRTISRIALIK